MNMKLIISIVCVVLSLALVAAGVAQIAKIFGDDGNPDTGGGSTDDTPDDGGNTGGNGGTGDNGGTGGDGGTGGGTGDDTPGTVPPEDDGLTKAEALALAEQLVTFGGYEEVDADSSRWIFEADRTILKTLEDEGYNVSFGTLFCLKEYDGSTINTGSPSVVYSASGFAANTSNSSCSLIYNTDGKHSPSGIFLETTESSYTFTYRLTELSEYDNVFVVECRAYVVLNYDSVVHVEGGEKTLYGGDTKPAMTLAEAQALAKSMITYRTYEIVDGDSVRWIYRVDEAKLAQLEEAGFNISFGAVTTVMFEGGGMIYNEPSGVVYSVAGGFVPTVDAGAVVVLVHNTDGTHSPSEIYTTEDGGGKYFSYKVTGTSTILDDLVLCSRAFVSVNYGTFSYVDGSSETLEGSRDVSPNEAMTTITGMVTYDSFTFDPEWMTLNEGTWTFKVDKDTLEWIEASGYHISIGVICSVKCGYKFPNPDYVQPGVVFTEGVGYRPSVTGRNYLYNIYTTDGTYSSEQSLKAFDDGTYGFECVHLGTGTIGDYETIECRAYIMLDKDNDRVYYVDGETAEFDQYMRTYYEEEALAMASEILKFKKFEILDEDSVRWIYEVDETNLRTLENEAYYIAYGMVITMLDGPDGVHHDRVANVRYDASYELETDLANSSFVTVYSSNYCLECTGEYITVDGKKCISYKLTGLSEYTGEYTFGVKGFVFITELNQAAYTEENIQVISDQLTYTQALELAEDLVEYDYFEPLENGDGGRWVFRVDKSKLARLEASNWIVSYGAVMSIRQLDDTVHNTTSPEVYLSTADNAFVSTLEKGNQVALVHTTDGMYNPTNTYYSEDDAHYYYTHMVTGMLERTETIKIECVGFTSLTYADFFYDNGGVQTFVGGAAS